MRGFHTRVNGLSENLPFASHRTQNHQNLTQTPRCSCNGDSGKGLASCKQTAAQRSVLTVRCRRTSRFVSKEKDKRYTSGTYHFPQRKLPDKSSGLTSLVLVTVPLTLVSRLKAAVFKSRISINPDGRL